MAPLAESLKRSVDSGEFVTTAEALTYIGASTSHTSMVADFVKTARQKVETDTRRSFLNQTWVYKLDDFPTSRDFIELPRPPLSSVTSLTYIPTTGGSAITWSSTNYEVDTNRTPGVVYTKWDIDWPSTRDVQNAVTITYVAGYSTAAANVPPEAKQATKMLVDDWFYHRSIDGPANTDNYFSLIHNLRWGDYQ